MNKSNKLRFVGCDGMKVCVTAMSSLSWARTAAAPDGNRCQASTPAIGANARNGSKPTPTWLR